MTPTTAAALAAGDLTYTDVQHHPDCDGWRTSHPWVLVSERCGNGTVLYRYMCEDCGPLHVGSAGSPESARSIAKREASCHQHEVRCAGECQRWS